MRSGLQQTVLIWQKSLMPHITGFYVLSSKGQPQAKVVVAVRRVVVVTIRRATVPGVVVPATATVHAVRPTFGAQLFGIYLKQALLKHLLFA